MNNPGFRRAFCRNCGCFVPKVSRNGQIYVVAAGLLDGDPGIHPDVMIWWDEHASWLKNLDALDNLGEGIGSAVREPARPGFVGEY